MTLPQFFVLFYKYIFLVWISSFIAKVVLYMVHWLLLDVKLFKICSGDLIVFQKYFDQVEFNNIIFHFLDGSFCKLFVTKLADFIRQ